MTRAELIGKIHELANNLPRAREDVAARLHALARIDLRDTADVDATLEILGADIEAPLDPTA